MDLLYVIAGAILIFLLGMACDRLVERIRRTKREIYSLETPKNFKWKTDPDPLRFDKPPPNRPYIEFLFANEETKNEVVKLFESGGYLPGHPLPDDAIKNEAFKQYVEDAQKSWQEHHPEHDPGLKK